ncbi:MAG: FAD-dependent oxidoreductase [Betaproteobacteria bacterium]|jgi:hypothetical protein
MKTEHFDVVVVGGGAAGAAAATGASRLGAKTLLLERYGFLGGAATNSQVLAYCGFFLGHDSPVPTVLGVGRDLLNHIQDLGFDTSARKSKNGWVLSLDPESVKLAFDRLVLGAKVDLCLHSFLVAAHREGHQLQSITVADHRGMRDISATCFVDASGEATLSSHAGVSMSQPGGVAAHLQPASMPMRIGGIAPDLVLDKERLIELIAQHNMHSDLKITRADGGFMTRLPGGQEVWWLVIDLPTAGLSGPDLTLVETDARERAQYHLQVLRKLPGFEEAHLLSTGPQIGIRETRRPYSLEDVTVQDGLSGKRRADAIARASWPMEVHESPGQARYLPIGGEGFFDIPHGAIQAKGILNLRLAGRVVGSDTEAYGSLRVMGTAFATGHAAGISAALHQPAQVPSSNAVRKELVQQNALV